MDFWKTLLVLLKRWYVALPVFVITVGAAGGVYLTTPMVYQSTGLLVLTSPSSGPTSIEDKETGQTNPLLAFDSSLAISASIVIQTINTPVVVKELGADKPEHTFELSGGNEGGPFISVVTESESEPGARELAVQVLDRVRAELTKRQEDLGAAPSTFIGVNEIVAPTEPEALTGGKLRAAGVAMVLGFSACLGAVFGLESFQNRKRGKDEPDDAVETTPAPVEPVRPAPRHTMERTQRIRPIQPANGKPANGVPAAKPLPKPGANQAGAWPAEEYREPPTRMVRPAAKQSESDG
ncbi:hypothetical protein [Actinokineospora fastidiosa]|uniref:Capsular polysaccharide biosynthesis protein n=1 Tax=Actinokineospora fastidiosa TaxID=1816 RepID=A0A918L8Q1_9PSEU|nr:hypothetical protein [Actinokineospora fastidiosa]GGS21590.1 hypothetical protein GCM10010171_12900 [Actinokineospora fastidiosa]